MAGKNEVLLRLLLAQARAQGHVVQQVVAHTAQRLHSSTVGLLMGLHAVALSGFGRVRHVEHTAIYAHQPPSMPPPYPAVGTIEPIEAFQDQVVEMLEEGGLQF